MKHVVVNEMPFLPRDDGYTILQPFFGIFRESVQAAWQAWLDMAGTRPQIVDPTALATLMSRLIWSEIKRRFEGVEGSKITHKGNLFSLNIRDKVVLFFKKVTRDLLTRNIKTGRSTMLALQLHLPEFPDAPRLVVGYRPNKLLTDLEYIGIIYKVGNVVKWSIPLLGADEELGGTTSFIPALPPAPIQPTKQPKFRKKNEAQ